MISSMPIDRRAAMLSAPMGPAPKTITVSPGAMPDRVMPWRATDSGSASAAWRGARPSGSRRTPADRATTYSAKAPSVWSEIMLLRFSHCDGFPSRQRRQVPQRGDAPPTTCSPVDQSVDLVADGDDGAAPFVAGHGSGFEAPAVAELVDVGAADAARVDADDDLVRTGARARAAPPPR